MAAIEALLQFSFRQTGVFTIDDARKYGVGRADLRRLIRQQRVIRAFRGIYYFSDAPYESSVVAAWQYVGIDAIASHGTALQLYDLGDIEPRHYEFTVPLNARRRRRGPLFRLHAREPMPQSYQVRGVPTTSPARAIADSAPLGDLTEGAVADVLRRRLATPAELRAEAQRRGPEVSAAIESAIEKAMKATP